MSIRQLDILAYPPAINLILLLLAALLFYRYRRTAITLFTASFLTLLLASLPIVSQSLRSTLLQHPPIPVGKLATYQADAIIILGGGLWSYATEYGGPSLIQDGLYRTRYGAFISRHTGLPIIVSGGSAIKNGTTEAPVMARVLREEFSIDNIIIEDQSKNTFENARNSVHIAKARGFNKIFLVTSAIHMQRAVETFSQYDIKIIPAPTGPDESGKINIRYFIPQGRSISLLSSVLHEYCGRLWYWLAR